MWGAIILGWLAAGTTQLVAAAQPVGDTRLVEAAKRDDLGSVKALIKAKHALNVQESDGSTALLWAAHDRSPGVVRTLLSAGADANQANRYGITPLLEACRQGDAAIAEALLSAGANPLLAQLEGETPLMAASAAGSLEIVQRLIVLGADVNATERVQHQTALMWASGEGHTDVVRVLLAAKADPNAIAKPSSLQRVGKLDAGRMWVDHSSGGLSTLMFAARQGQIEAARELVKAGADLKYANPDGVTALMIAVLNDRLDLAAMLLDTGADPNDGSLLETVQVHNLRLNSTAGDATRPRPSHSNQLTALDLMGRLLDAGADPGRAAQHTLHLDGTGTPAAANQSAMALALSMQDVGALRVLLAKGGDPNRLLENNLTPLMAAIKGGGGGFFGFGVAPAPYRDPGSHSAEEAVQLLVLSGADVKATTPLGDTALHSAAQSGNLAIIRLLADRGAVLTAADKAGFTALDFAMGKTPPDLKGGRRGGGGGGGFPPPGGPRQDGPHPEAVQLLRQLMGN